jgi:glycosyltransferase involved in cell wall biosynthesis
MLSPAWIANADFDVFHLHFGFDACSPDDLTQVVTELRRRRKPFVFTVHDLRNPHHETHELHDAQLDVLVPAADALITLTTGAAAEIRRRWGRDAMVLAHPHVVPFETMATARDSRCQREGTAFRVGLHAKSLRSSMDPRHILPTLVETVRELPNAVLQVNAHRDVLEDDGLRLDADLASYLRDHEASGDLELHVHDYLSDDDLWAYLSSLDVSVLPYRFGTHSGWMEACRDLGTTVVAPSCGYYADQGPVLTYDHDEATFDAESLRTAVRTAYVERPRFGAGVEERRRQRGEIALAHELLYRTLAG